MIIAEHTVRLESLPRLRGTDKIDYKNLNILDLGCRDFSFTNHFKERGARVYSVDIDNLEGDYIWCAISDKDGVCGVVKTEDAQATHIGTGTDVRMMTLETLNKYVSVDHWHIIKMDIEGEEMSVLQSANHPIADQVTVEFHAHTGRQNRKQIDALLTYLKKWYVIENRYWEDRHCAGCNYWDILLVAR